MPDSLKVLVKYDQRKKIRNTSCIEILNLSNFSLNFLFKKKPFILVSMLKYEERNYSFLIFDWKMSTYF